MENFESMMAEILEVDSVVLTDELQSFDCWDSLTVLSIIAYASESFGVELSNEDIIGSRTLDGLKRLIGSRM
jgi:acyl carrier protein